MTADDRQSTSSAYAPEGAPLSGTADDLGGAPRFDEGALPVWAEAAEVLAEGVSGAHAAPTADATLQRAANAPIGAHAAPTPHHAAPGFDETPLTDPALAADGEDALFAAPLAGEAPGQGDYAAPAPAAAPAAPTPSAPADQAPHAVGNHAAPETPAGHASADAPGAPVADNAEDASPADTADLEREAVDAALAAAAAGGAEPSTTAEIDVTEVEARLTDPGSTQSFEAIPAERVDTDSTYDAGTTTTLMWGARSDVGCVRTHNEDSYLVQSPLFCVSDGMGGHAAGEVASSIAVETIAKHAPTTADPAQLARAVETANTAIMEAAANGVGRPGMGCTATAAYIEGTQLAIAHVGDSRAYLVHDHTLIRVTRDHSYVEELVDAGEITADEARVHPNRSVITRALGSDPTMYADHFQLNIEEGDRLILCSDGLSSMIPDAEIETIANQSATAQMAVDNLVDAALAAGGSDNVTVVVVDVVDDGRLREALRRRKRNVLIAVAGLVAALAIALIAMFVSITGSTYLGVKDDCVAIYTGIPESFMGISLHWLEDETEIEVSDLPEDTQRRLEEGIAQPSIEDARSVLNEYRRQIFADQAQRAQTAEATQAQTEGGAGTENSAGAAGDASADGATSGTADAGSADNAAADTLANTVAPTQSTQEGGTA